MSTSPIPQTIDILSREKGIDPQVIISAIEDAVVTAARKQFKTGEDLRARYNAETGDVELFALMTVVDEVQDAATEISLADVEAMGVEGAEVGDQLEFPKPREELGRIAAQTAKQIIFQKVREAERNNVYDEYIGRVGELVHGFVKRFEGGRIIVDLGKIEAVLPKTQQSRAEAFSQGERVRVVINTVSKDTKGPQVEVSRTSPELVKRWFEMEVPEIYDGTVVIKGAVRQPGERAKVAVRSRERDVDPVGACVGMRGSRVQSIMRELHGEKIDVILYSDDLITFAQNALAPAKITRVSPIHHEDGAMSLDCVVEDDQLSLAIGKKGQNVRLASALIGLKIEIKGETEVKGEVAQALTRMLEASRQRQVAITDVPGIGEKTAEKLAEAGLSTLGDLLEKTAAELAEIPGIGEKSAEKILAAAQEHEEARKAAEEAGDEAEESADANADMDAEGNPENQEQEEPSQEGEASEEQAQETAPQTTVRE